MLFFVTAYEQKSVMLDSQAGFSHRHHSLPLLPMSTTERPQSGGVPMRSKTKCGGLACLSIDRLRRRHAVRHREIRYLSLVENPS